MKRLILSFFVVIFLLCGFVNAQNQTSIPIEGDDISALKQFLNNIDKAKGEFEKTTDYEKRIRSSLSQTVYGNLRGDSIWTAISQVGQAYDADSETMLVEDISERVPPGKHRVPEYGPACNGMSQIINRSYFLGLIFVNYSYFFNATPGWRTNADGTNAFARFKISNTDARSMKDNARIAYKFHVVVNDQSWNGCYTTNSTISVFLDSILLFDLATGKIYYDSESQKKKPVTPVKKTTTKTQVKKKRP